MSATRVNPGSWLLFTGSLKLAENDREVTVIDEESGQEVSLAGLLDSFREDLGSPVVGPVKITIEPA